jgi:hypothetical protein
LWYEASCPVAVETYLEEFPLIAADRERKLGLVYAELRY